MKCKNAIICPIVLFTLVNTSYLIEKLPGLWDILLSLVLLILHFILCIILFIQLNLLIKARFREKSRIISTIILLTKVKNDHNFGELVMYQNKKDTIGLTFQIISYKGK